MNIHKKSPMEKAKSDIQKIKKERKGLFLIFRREKTSSAYAHQLHEKGNRFGLASCQQRARLPRGE
jgi:hypothetical protein